MKTFAVLDTDHTGRLISLGHTEAIPRIFGRVYLTDVVRKELGDWVGKNAESVHKFAKDPPEWVIERSPTAIAPAVAKANETCVRLDAGEASAISLAFELSKDGSRGVVLSDDADARKFLNYEQNPATAQELTGEKWNTFGFYGPTLPAPEDQKIFATNLLSSLCQAGEREIVPDLKQEVKNLPDVGVTLSPTAKNKVNEFTNYLQESQQQKNTQSQSH